MAVKDTYKALLRKGVSEDLAKFLAYEAGFTMGWLKIITIEELTDYLDVKEAVILLKCLGLTKKHECENGCDDHFIECLGDCCPICYPPPIPESPKTIRHDRKILIWISENQFYYIPVPSDDIIIDFNHFEGEDIGKPRCFAQLTFRIEDEGVE